MRAQIIYADNPFAPADRRVRQLRHRAPISRLAPRGRRPVLALLNGNPVLRQNHGWQRTRVMDGDQLVFVTLPLGGGGGGGGSNPLQVILTIALFAVAPGLAGSLTGIAAGAAGVQGMLLAGATMAIQMAGASLINAAFPTPKVENGPTPHRPIPCKRRAIPRGSSNPFRCNMAGCWPIPISRRSPIGNMPGRNNSCITCCVWAAASFRLKTSESRTRP